MTTYYVRTTGNDTTGDGLSALTAWLTVNKAHDTIPIAGGHTIDVGAGTFAENSGAAGYLSIDRNFTNPVIIQGAGEGVTILTGSSGTDTIRAPGTASRNLTFKDLTIRPLSGAKAFNFTGTATSNLILDQVTIETVGGALGTAAGLISTAGTHALNFLTLNNVTMDTVNSTNANALSIIGTLTNFTVSGYLIYNGKASTICFRIGEAAGTHLWSADVSIEITTSPSVGVWYEGTGSVVSISMGVTNPFYIDTPGDDALIIAGGTGVGVRSAVTLGPYMDVSGAGGARVDGYCSTVNIATGGAYHSVSGTSPALSVASDGATNDIQTITCGAVTATTVGGHGGIFGVGSNDLTLTGGTYNGSDHSLVIKTNGFTIRSVTCLSAAQTSLLFKGATNGTCTHCQLFNSQSGGYCVDFREQGATLSDDITFTNNRLEATGAAKAISVVQTGVGNGIIEQCNRITQNKTGDILGTAVTDLPWTPAYAGYAITTNGKENCVRGPGSIAFGTGIGTSPSLVYPIVQ